MRWSACSPLLRWSWSTPRSTLFSFSSLSDFSPWNLEPHTYRERKIFPYKQKQLYDIVADVGSYPQFVPFCTGSRIIASREASSPIQRPPTVMEAELTVGFLAFKESYVSQVTCHPYEAVEAVASSSTTLFKTLSTTWKFQPAPSENTSRDHGICQTLVTLDLAYAFTSPIHAQVSSAFFGQVSRLMVKAFEDRCLEVYGRPASNSS